MASRSGRRQRTSSNRSTAGAGRGGANRKNPDQHDWQDPRDAAGKPAPDSGPRPGEPVPRDFGRDGISSLVTHDRALRAREVSRPRPEDEAEAEAAAEAMLKRLGRRPR